MKLDAFVDFYASLNYNTPHPQGGTNVLRAFDVNNGFALNWVGLNGSIDPDPVGGTVQLRFGPGAQIYSANDASIGLANVKQAFATYRPGGKDGAFTLDFGKFDQPFGSEVADSHLNMNYTRSVLFNFAQPLYFTGVRADYVISPMVDLKLIAVNGWNRSVDNNLGKSFAAQLMLKPADQFIAYLGYMISPEQGETATVTPAAGGGTITTFDSDANTRFRHTIDAVFDINPTKEARVLINGTYNTEQVLDALGAKKTVSWYGANLAARYAITDSFGASIRGEYFKDSDGFGLTGTVTNTDATVIDGTLTLDIVPAPHFKIMFENRIDSCDREIFPTPHTMVKTQITSTLGIIASTL